MDMSKMRLILRPCNSIKDISPQYWIASSSEVAAAEGRCCRCCGNVSMQVLMQTSSDKYRLEEAHEPEALAQETIIENMSTEESKRISKVRNIGIAVCALPRED